MIRSSMVLLALLLTLSTLPVRAQAQNTAIPDTWVVPNTTALVNLAARLSKVKAGKDSQGAVTRFTPSGDRLSLDEFVEHMFKTADKQAQLRKVLQSIFKAYEAVAKESGFSDDVAAALATYVSVHYSVYHGGHGVADSITKAMTSQFHAALDTDEMRAYSNEDKQRLYEYFIMMAGYTGSIEKLGAEHQNTSFQKVAIKLGANGLRSILSVDPDRVLLAETGLTIAPDRTGSEVAHGNTGVADKSAAAVGQSGNLSDISYRVPAGWTEKKVADGIVLSIRAGSDAKPRDCTMIVTAGRRRSGTLANAFYAVWRESVLPYYVGPAKPFAFVCQLPGGLNCAFAVEELTKRTNGGKYTVAQYAVDAGTSVVSIMVEYSAHIGSVFIDPQWTDPVQQFFDSLKVRGAPLGKPIVTRGELAGTWSNSDSATIASYVDSHGNYLGDASSRGRADYTFSADGTYSQYWFYDIHGVITRGQATGAYRIDGSVVVMTPKGTGQVEKQRFLGRGAADDGKETILYLQPEYDKRPIIIGHFFKDRYALIPPK